MGRNFLEDQTGSLNYRLLILFQCLELLNFQFVARRTGLNNEDQVLQCLGIDISIVKTRFFSVWEYRSQ